MVNSYRICCFFFLAITVLLTARPASAGEPVLLTPETGSIIYGPSSSVHFVVKASVQSDVKELKLRSSSGPVSPLTVQDNENGRYIHYRSSLSPGENRFSFSSSGFPEVTLDYRPSRTLMNKDFGREGVYLYHRDTGSHDQCLACHESVSLPGVPFIKTFPCKEKSPTCYSCHKRIFENVVWRHSPAAGLLCEICHQKDESSGLVSVTSGQDAGLCYRCHQVKGQAFGDQACLHQPVGLKLCSICHDPHGDKYRYQLWAEGRGEICVTCHADKKKLLQGGEIDGERVHDIIRGGGCIVCHDAHASPNPYMLLRPVNELCADCHNDLLGVNKGHPVGGHPLKGGPDPLDPDKEYSCASCHDPHSSRYQYLLVGSLIGGHVCKMCHN
ncbi:MAG: cytochrome c3 family protein [Desulfobia sp.]